MTKWSLMSVVIVFSLLLASSALPGQGATAWEQTAGPPGGRASCVAVDIEDPTIVYAGMDQSGIYRSTNGGRSWEESSPRIGEWIGGIASTPHGVFVACGRFVLYRTTDRGVSWEEVTVAPETRITGIHYGTLGDILLASSDQGGCSRAATAARRGGISPGISHGNSSTPWPSQAHWNTGWESKGFTTRRMEAVIGRRPHSLSLRTPMYRTSWSLMMTRVLFSWGCATCTTRGGRTIDVTPGSHETAGGAGSRYGEVSIRTTATGRSHKDQTARFT